MRTRVMYSPSAVVWITALTVVALVMRFALLPTRLLLEDDSPYYVALAAQILRGDWSGAFNDYWSQFYPVTVAAMGLLIRDTELAARLVSVVCGALLVPATCLLVRELDDRLSALVAGLAVAIQSWLLVFSALALTEMLFALCTVTALALILRAGRLGGFGRFALAGCVTALAILTRPEGVLLVVFLLGAVALRILRRPSWRSLRECAIALATLIGVWAPQSIGTYLIYGHLNLVWKSSVNVALSDTFNDPSQSEKAVHGLDQQGQMQLIAEARQANLGAYWLNHAEAALSRMWENARLVWRENMTAVLMPAAGESKLLVVALVGLAIFGAGAGLYGTQRYAVLVVLVFVTLYSIGLLSVLVHPRLLVPLTPFVLGFIALGLARVLSAARWAIAHIRQSSWRRIATLAICAIGVAGLLWVANANYAWAYERQDPFATEPVLQREAGEWLRANVPQTARVLSHNPQTPFYFYRDWPFDRALQLPWAAPSDVLTYARSQSIRYVILEEWMILAAHYPFESWLDLTHPHPGLRLVHVFGAAPVRLIVFETAE